jgi:hypothetical protein
MLVLAAMLVPALRSISEQKATGIGIVVSWQILIVPLLVMFLLGLLSFWLSGKVTGR